MEFPLELDLSFARAHLGYRKSMDCANLKASLSTRDNFRKFAFVGDACLGASAAKHLVSKRDGDAGTWTKAKSKMVSRTHCARIFDALDEASNGRLRRATAYLGDSDNIKAEVVEAMLRGMMLDDLADSGRDDEILDNLVENWFLDSCENLGVDAVSKLHEACAKAGVTVTLWTKTTGDQSTGTQRFRGFALLKSIDKIAEFSGPREHFNKKLAKEEVARLALKSKAIQSARETEVDSKKNDVSLLYETCRNVGATIDFSIKTTGEQRFKASADLRLRGKTKKVSGTAAHPNKKLAKNDVARVALTQLKEWVAETTT